MECLFKLPKKTFDNWLNWFSLRNVELIMFLVVLKSLKEDFYMSKFFLLLLITVSVSNAFACGGTKDEEEKKRFDQTVTKFQ